MPTSAYMITQFVVYFDVFLHIIAAIFFLLGTILLACSFVPIHPEYEGSGYMPYKLIGRRFRAGLVLNFFGFIIIVALNITKLLQV